jgi:3-deoxy-7-phosphoheptulonate synthase
VILVFDESSSPECLLRAEQAVRRAGADPKRLAAEGGRAAIEATGLTHAQAMAVPGVAFILDGAPAYRRVARRGEEEGTRIVSVRGVKIGGPEVVLMAGPCAVEHEDQLEECALAAKRAGARLLRGGAFKPRTSPYSFQGMGDGGLRLLRAAADRHDLAVVTEVLEPGAVGQVAEYADMLQVGSRNMQNTALLRAVGRQSRPVLLKRGMSATLDEWLLAAEYIADAGNEDIVLCERGVRTFDTASRNMLDLAAVPLLRARTGLPVAVDPSHGVGVKAAVLPMALAAVAAGADALMVECHPEPGTAKSDGFQALTPAELITLGERVRVVARAIDRA